jgi:hypothetical protein
MHFLGRRPLWGDRLRFVQCNSALTADKEAD